MSETAQFQAGLIHTSGVGMQKEEPPVVVEQTFNASIAAVWQAITKPDQMRRWFFENIPSFKAEVGFSTQFSIQNEERSFLHIWKVTKVVPRKLIAYTWKYQEYPGDSVVRFELFAGGRSTTLRLSHQVTESFPDGIPEFERESCVGGWTYFINERLKKFLEEGG